ncbi:hypothetical protein PHLGIDRAFT_71543 [Phlebiopsis gigantea 11061_1 CR5-6]|uniref:histidine kinase n=1 Tax=Phlebiopsis gigantea (strain 11061_1 CR5-6) TaxID=745531 RepID=A0A0C3NPP0_PHLG1|nr:hypothetical protein PHLGIDRAFT_71543 [Phlebiopsis gigantea 11061_1 CR5-6]
MPFRSRTSLASGTGSSTKQDDRHISSLSVEKLSNTIALSPLSPNPEGLPLPATQRSLSFSAHRKKKTRIDASAKVPLRVHWERFMRRMGTGTAPSSASNFDDSTGDSNGSKGVRSVVPEDPDAPLDEVVVEREWADAVDASLDTRSDPGISPDKSGGSNHLGGTNTDHDSFTVHADGFWGSCVPLIWIRWRVWPFLLGFFWTRFLDEKSEEHYNKENWYLRKNLAVWSALFYILNWTLATAFNPQPFPLPDIIFYYCVMPVLTFPLIILVIYDWPRDRNITYQIALSISTWSWGVYQLVFIRLCDYTTGLQTIALFGLKLHRFPALLGMSTFLAVSVSQRIQPSSAVRPLRRPPPAGTADRITDVVNFISFQIFLLYVHFMRENAERRLYTLRDQLKVQFLATQKAQVNERKAADSKRRLTSYVFHEVRVPLNTALLAVQNMEASGMVAKGQEIEFKALEGSLSMMSKVLNDVLDFNRMDSGRFESVLKPYAFHKVMRSLFVPLQLATNARSLRFMTELDRNIDNVARKAMYDAMALSDEELEKRMALDEDGIVVGDETRLRQIITNLASNACKFTPAGGQLSVTTRLIRPNRFPRSFTRDTAYSAGTGTATGQQYSTTACAVQEHSPPSAVDTPLGDEDETHVQLSASYLSQHNVMHSKPPPPLEWIVVRIEISDTGCGIRRKDMVQSKLFSAFNQTEMGRLQGGKGTGLGLALVRQIVKLSGGRLGVQSKHNEGSTFWVELPLGVGLKALPGLKSVETPDASGDHPDYSLSGIMRDAGAMSGSQVETPDTQAQDRTTAALHGIMEQGGLVELRAKRDDTSPVLTRTIGDPSTGTDTIASSATEEDASPSRSPRALPLQVVERPNYLELPAPQDFSQHGFPSPPSMTPASTSSLLHSSTLGSPPQTPGHGHENELKVLVVDDDPLTRKLMSRMLTRIGCKVSTAENGEIALEMILGVVSRVTPSSEETGSAGLSAEGPLAPAVSARPSMAGDDYKYAVVFLDNQMPVLSGLETVAKLREMARRDFVVGVTGNALLSDQQEYLDAGVDHVLTKPVYEKSLRAMLTIADERRKRATPHAEVPAPLARS